MPKRVYCNVEGHRLFDNGRQVEDVTKVGLPTLEHYTVSIENVAGMAMDVDIPNPARLKASTFTVYHNNGVNGQYLEDPEHDFEFRVAQQYYDTVAGKMSHRSVKYRVKGLFTKSEKGDIETGNPVGTTCTYSVLRYEEYIDSNEVTVVDAGGTVRKNGVDYTENIESLLS